MAYESISLAELIINKDNDRHGELPDETAAMAWLLNKHEQHMRHLASDIVAQGKIYEPPLVFPLSGRFLVFDGNRRVTCLKLLGDPLRAPTPEAQKFFETARSKWNGPFPTEIECQIEFDREEIDDILYRRHTGSQSGVGQSQWDDVGKANFIDRTGKKTKINVAEEIENLLHERGYAHPCRRVRHHLDREDCTSQNDLVGIAARIGARKAFECGRSSVSCSLGTFG